MGKLFMEKMGLGMEPGMNSLDAERNHRSTSR